MNIESIVIQGFKSFAERSRLEFVGGINAVIGPNGSGKSNVIEAIRWATHSARARELRAQHSTELIFHGSEGKSAVGFAEVVLELGSIQLARRIYKDGSGEQELHGKKVLVRDVQHALRGTGLGMGGLAVIGQGEVSGVVSAEPKVLQGYLEEATGVSKLSHNEKQTRDLLQESQNNLEQLENIALGQQEQLQRLAKEAEDAKKYQHHQQQKRLLEHALLYGRKMALQAELDSLKHQEQEATQHTAAIKTALLSVGQQSEQLRNQLTEAGLQQAEYQKVEQALDNLTTRITDVQNHMQRNQKEIERLMGDRDKLQNITPVALPETSSQALSALLSKHKIDHDSLARRLKTAEDNLKKAYAALQKSTEQQTLFGQIELLGSEQAQKTESLIQLKSQLHSEQQSLKTQQEAYAQALQHHEQHKNTLSELKNAQQMRGQNKANLEKEFKRLEQLLNSYSRFGEGSKNALTSGIEGIVGSVADCLYVPPELDTAMTALLGRRLEHVVVDTAEVAKNIIAHLKRYGGRTTFLPLDTLQVRLRSHPALLKEKGVQGYAHELVRSDPEIVGQHVLGDTLVVGTLDDAIALGRKYPQKPRMVTLDGEVQESSGAMTGGMLRDSGVSVLADQRRYDELDAQLQQLNNEQNQAEQHKTHNEQQLKHWEQEVQYSRQAYQKQQSKVAQLERQHTQENAVLEALKQQIVSLNARAGTGEHTVDVVAFEQQAEALREELGQSQATLNTLAEQVHHAKNLELQHRTQQEQLKQAQTLTERIAECQLLAKDYTNQHGILQQQQNETQQERNRLRPESLAPLEQAYQKATQEQRKLTVQLSEAQSRLENSKVQLARKDAQWQEYAEVQAPEPMPTGTLRDWQKQLSQSEEALERLGAVNHRAEQEHEQLYAKHSELQSQILESHHATRDIEKALVSLKAHIAQELKAAFSRVSQAFSGYVSELLGGVGVLQQQEEGLGLNVQPKGKRTRALHLLSAGERTMVGLAFLFALAHAPAEGGGLPLAILDEVDAPLDEANIRRFTHFLKLLSSRGSQFILVTHQKATMEVADAIWGVTTNSGGVSKIYSIKQVSG